VDILHQQFYVLILMLNVCLCLFLCGSFLHVFIMFTKSCLIVLAAQHFDTALLREFVLFSFRWISALQYIRFVIYLQFVKIWWLLFFCNELCIVMPNLSVVKLCSTSSYIRCLLSLFLLAVRILFCLKCCALYFQIRCVF